MNRIIKKFSRLFGNYSISNHPAVRLQGEYNLLEQGLNEILDDKGLSKRYYADFTEGNYSIILFTDFTWIKSKVYGGININIDDLMEQLK